MNQLYNFTNNFIKIFPHRDPYKIADNLNITVQYHTFIRKIKGIFIYDKESDIKIIGINDNLEENKKRIVFAHELGHAVLHPFINRFFIDKYTLFNGDRFELEANIFATNLLIPDEKLNYYIQNNYSINMTAYELRVPVELLELKLKYYIPNYQLKLRNISQYRKEVNL